MTKTTATKTTIDREQFYTELLKDPILQEPLKAITDPDSLSELSVELSNEQRKPSIQSKGESMMHLKPNREVMTILGLSLVLLAAPFIKPDAALAGGFASTCIDIHVQSGGDGAYLQASCPKANGQKVPSRLKISDYIANYGGRLSWALGGGGFHSSCRSVTYPVTLFSGNRPVPLRTIMGATCGDGRGGWSIARINLNDKISNQNGVLAIDR